MSPVISIVSLIAFLIIEEPIKDYTLYVIICLFGLLSSRAVLKWNRKNTSRAHVLELSQASGTRQRQPTERYTDFLQKRLICLS